MGIRIALGAEGDDILKLIVEEGMRLAGIGILIGLAPALALPNLLAGAFPGFSVHAAPVFVSVPVLVAVASLLASYVPARWVSCVDPMVALRHE
jgi:putative ABC transport system permease protein